MWIMTNDTTGQTDKILINTDHLLNINCGKYVDKTYAVYGIYKEEISYESEILYAGSEEDVKKVFQDLAEKLCK